MSPLSTSILAATLIQHFWSAGRSLIFWINWHCSCCCCLLQPIRWNFLHISKRDRERPNHPCHSPPSPTPLSLSHCSTSRWSALGCRLLFSRFVAFFSSLLLSFFLCCLCLCLYLFGCSFHLAVPFARLRPFYALFVHAQSVYSINICISMWKCLLACIRGQFLELALCLLGLSICSSPLSQFLSQSVLADIFRLALDSLSSPREFN